MACVVVVEGLGEKGRGGVVVCRREKDLKGTRWRGMKGRDGGARVCMGEGGGRRKGKRRKCMPPRLINQQPCLYCRSCVDFFLLVMFGV